MKKYNRTYHLPCSEELHDDDKKMAHIKDLIGKEIVGLEKLDGGNTCLDGQKVFARTHSVETTHGSFSMIKSVSSILYHYGFLSESEKIFGENMQGIHSINYSKLTFPLYIFNIYEKETGIWKSWDDVELFSQKTGVPTTPVLFRKTFTSEKELLNCIREEMKKPSVLGGEREGVVVRVADSFHDSNFETYVGKSVRKGHVQTDEHWSKNWEQADIDPSYLERIIFLKTAKDV